MPSIHSLLEFWKVAVNGQSWCIISVSYLYFCLLFRFLVGNKSDLRDPRCSESQVSQERAVSFSRARNMMFFETSAKNLSNASSNDGSGKKVQYQQHQVEDIVVAVAAKLKRQRKSSIVNVPSQNGSFRIGNRKTPQKETWTCCWDRYWVQVTFFVIISAKIVIMWTCPWVHFWRNNVCHVNFVSHFEKNFLYT